jgi:hypothetical protein
VKNGAGPIDILNKEMGPLVAIDALLTRQLLEGCLSTCSVKIRTPLLFTTQDALLMDQDLLRRDEMWVAERDGAGSSSLTPFSEYKRTFVCPAANAEFSHKGLFFQSDFQSDEAWLVMDRDKWTESKLASLFSWVR